MTMPDLADLVDRRARMMKSSELSAEDAAEVRQLTTDLRQRLSGGARAKTLDPIADQELLRKLARREPVNPVADDADLENRLAGDRRVFAWVHPGLPQRPTNVVWTALWQGLPDSLQAILDPAAPTLDPGTADTAVFYSIWSTETALAGLGQGRRLIEESVTAIADEFPNISNFVTLSPIPGFVSWLNSNLPEVASNVAESPAQTAGSGELARQGAQYLTSWSDKGKLLDPVARFHMGNGARLLRIIAGADTSELGETRSGGLMANYRYAPEDTGANRRVMRQGKLALGDQVINLLRT